MLATLKALLDEMKDHKVLWLTSVLMVAALGYIGSSHSIVDEFLDNERQFNQQAQVRTETEKLLAMAVAVQSAMSAFLDSVNSYEAFRKAANAQVQTRTQSRRLSQAAMPVGENLAKLRTAKLVVEASIGTLQGTKITAKNASDSVEQLAGALAELNQILVGFEQRYVSYAAGDPPVLLKGAVAKLLEGQERFVRNASRFQTLLTGLQADAADSAKQSLLALAQLTEQRKALWRRVYLLRVAVLYVLGFSVIFGIVWWRRWKSARAQASSFPSVSAA